MEEKITCSQCGKIHYKTTSNCCWINCYLDKDNYDSHRICGNCGSTDISNMEMGEDDDESQYWCCLKCNNCGLEGCQMCI